MRKIDYLTELHILKHDFGCKSLDEVAEEVLKWHNAFDGDFVEYCKDFLDQYTELVDNDTV